MLHEAGSLYCRMILCGAYFCAVQVVKKLWHFVLCWCDGRFEAFLSHYCQLLGARTDEIYQKKKHIIVEP